MKNLLLILILLGLFFALIYSVLLCMDKEAELRCIKSLGLDDDISLCEVVEDDE